MVETEIKPEKDAEQILSGGGIQNNRGESRKVKTTANLEKDRGPGLKDLSLNNRPRIHRCRACWGGGSEENEKTK